MSYDSDDGRATGRSPDRDPDWRGSYATSAEMAKELGAFPSHERNADHMLRVIRNHRNAAYGATEGYERAGRETCAAGSGECAGSEAWRNWRWRPGTKRWRWVKNTATATRRCL